VAAILEVIDLVKQYPGVRAVDGVSFAVREGICFGLLGPNGAGKTTTVEMMEGVVRPTSGQVLYRGAPPGGNFKDEVGIQFQSTVLQDFLTTREVLELFGSFYPKTIPLEELVEMCALGEFLERDNRKLSGGQRQRLFLALALVNDPDLLFLDEPTTGLDPQARQNFWRLITSIKQRAKTILLTTHYMEEADVLCEEVAIMDRGQIIAQGEPGELVSRHFKGVRLELPRQGFPAGDRFPWPVATHGERVEIQTEDANKTLAYLMKRKVPLTDLKIMTPTLEDLFLDLTGRELRN
jgi:ABC-2 type transport system ATP-binding protein